LGLGTWNLELEKMHGFIRLAVYHGFYSEAYIAVILEEGGDLVGCNFAKQNFYNKAMISKNKKEWYEFGVIVDYLLLLFPPLGIYAIYKSRKFPALVKIILTLLIVLSAIFIVCKIVARLKLLLIFSGVEIYYPNGK